MYRLLTLSTVWMMLTAALLAQSPAPDKPADSRSPDSKTPEGLPPDFPTVEKIMEQAVHNIAMRYNLNDEQKNVTNEIMKRDVMRFLNEHYEQVWPLIRELIACQYGTKPPDSSDDVTRIGKAALPLLGEIKEAIYRGNAEWREYLTEEQKRMHDYDLAEMDKQFGYIRKSFESWAGGDPAPGGIFPPAPAPELSPPIPRRPPAGLPKPEVKRMSLDMFETYVDNFIRDYELDAAQLDTARSILKEYREKASDHINRNKAELDKILTARMEAESRKDKESLTKIEAEYKKVMEPVTDLFGKMCDRLKAILTTAQIERYEAKKTNPEPKPESRPQTKEQSKEPSKDKAPAAEAPKKP